MIEGLSVYDAEVEELAKRLQAKGVLLIVIGGNRNKRDVEYASVIRSDVLDRVIETLGLVSDALKRDGEELSRDRRI